MANLIKLSDKFESVMYIALLAVTAAIRGTYQELGLEFLKNRSWLRRVSYLYKIIFTKSLPYLYELIPPIQRSHHPGFAGCFKTLRCRTGFFDNSFLPFNVK